MSRHMEEIYREVFGKEAQKILAEQQQKQASLKRKADPANVDAPLREKSSSAIEEASMSTPRPPLKRLRTKGPGVFASPAESLSSGLGQSPPSSSDSLVRALSFELAGDKDDSEKDGSQQELDESGKNKFQLLAAAEAKRRGALGGRPSGKPGPGSRKIELPVAVRAKMASEMSKALSSFASEKDFWISMKRKYALSIPKLKSIFSDREALQSETQKKKLTTKPLLFQSGGKGTKKTAGSKRCRGFRKSGGGRKSRWPALLSELKAWVEEQRSYGHSVSKTTLMDRWIFLPSEKMLNLQAEAAAQVDASAKAETLQKAELAKSEKESLCKNYTARQSKCNRLMDSMGLKFMKPDLTTKLSAQEEAVRAMLTWQLWDRTLWKAFFSPLDVLGESVADPSAFRNNVESLVCIYSDQIPLWVKASSEREIFCALESKPMPQQQIREALKAHFEKCLADPARGQSLVPVKLPDSATGSGQRQKRGLKEAQADRYRVTYEARQILYNLGSSEKELVGDVLPGLLIFHGTHARLSNISESGTFITDESFFWKGRLIERKAGTSAGRLLLPWRKLRASEPALFESISIMQQPAGNVDNIIFAWSQAELSKHGPCQIHQRDSFSASWSPSSAQSLYLSQSLQTIVAPKMTASLQLTDTDYSRSFKALCKSKMADLRSSGQEALLKAGKREVWQASHSDMLLSVVSAQKEMKERNLKNKWVVSGLRRNGMLAYAPDLQGRKLVPLANQPAAEMPQGSSRMQSSWLQDRYNWVDANLEPLEPDWSLLPGVKAVTDLIEYEYWQGSETAEKDEAEEEALLDLHELPETLQWPCIESGLLQVPLKLQALAWKLDKKDSVDVKAKRRSKKLVKALRKQAKQCLAGKFRQKMKEKLKEKSLKQALDDLVPISGIAAAKSKHKSGRSVAKALAKDRRKQAKKNAAKMEAAKVAKEMISDEIASGSVVGAAAVEEKAASLPEAACGPLKGKRVRVSAELHGKETLCGKEGICTSHNLVSDQVNVISLGAANATEVLPESSVTMVEKSWLKPLKWKQMTLSRSLKQRILEVCGGGRVFLEEDMKAAEPVEEIKTKPQMLLDHHLSYGWELLRWHFSNAGAASDFFQENGVLLLDPKLSNQWLLPVVSDFVADKSLLEKEMLRVKNAAKSLLVPVHGQNHWTLLLLLMPGGSEDTTAVHYFDSLQDEEKGGMSDVCASRAEKLLKLLMQSDAVSLPKHEPSPTQESDDCGFWVLAYALEVCCMLRHEGPKSRGSLKVSVLNLKGLLRLWCSQMKTEQEKCEKALDLRIEKLESERETLRNQALNMAEAVTKAKEAKSDAEALADKVFNQGKSPEYNDLPQSAKDAIDKIELMGNIKVCSRCRYSSGCLSCDKDKALRYHLNVLRHSLGMKPLACPGLSSSLLPLPLWCVSHVLCHTDPAAAPALPVCLLLVVVFGGFKVLCHTDPAAAPALPVCLLHVVLIIAQHSVLIIAQHSDAFCACVF